MGRASYEEEPQPTACMTAGGFTSLTGPQNKLGFEEPRFLGPTAAMELHVQRPRLKPVLQNGTMVLSWMPLTPYEPCREASLKHLTCKTVFLLDMASAEDIANSRP